MRKKMEVLLKDLPTGDVQAICTGIPGGEVCTFNEVFVSRKYAFLAVKAHITETHIKWVYS